MGRREQNKLEKRTRLEAEGLKAFLDLGYDRASIEQIAAAADVARGTFYLYFSDKLALFEVLIDRWFDPVMDVMRETHEALEVCDDRSKVLGIYEDMGMGLAVAGITDPECVMLAFREARRAGEAGERLRRRELQLHEAVFDLTQLAASRGLITAEDPKLTGFIILGAVEKLYYEFLAGTDLGDPQKMARAVVRLFAKVLELPLPDQAGDEDPRPAR